MTTFTQQQGSHKTLTDKSSLTKIHNKDVWVYIFIHKKTFLKCSPAVFSSLSQLKCCGFTNYTDFVGSTFEKENGGNLPPSCCWTNSAPCTLGVAERSAVKVRWKTPLQIYKKHTQSVSRNGSLFSVASLF